jgi:DNA topoisomerase 6 subunit A-like protein
MARKAERVGGMAADIIGVIREGTKKWTKTVKAEERSPASRFYRYARMTQERGVRFKEAAAEIMEEAYRKVSGPDGLPANARQIMYAARPHIQKQTGKVLRPDYFTQVLLPNYLNKTAPTWNVVYDARGHFAEPHGGRGFGVGTLEVRDYLANLHQPRIIAAAVREANVETLGPSGSFGAVLFVEKEGFDPLLRAAKIAERFELALMSTKGMSVTAARELADEMCASHHIPLLMLRDFDKAGYSIAATMQSDTRRYEFRNSIKTIDLGLSLEDVTAMGLESEYQHHPKGRKAAMAANLRTNGASEEEIAFMFQDFDRLRSTRRVELNAMTSPQFIAFVERKLHEHGIGKIVPDSKLLAETYAAIERGRRLKEAVEELGEKIAPENAGAPADLRRRVRNYLKQNPADRWTDAVAAIAAERAP